MITSTLLIIGIALVACLIFGGLVVLWAGAEEKIFRLNCTVSDLNAENTQLVRLADSLKTVNSHQNLVINSYVRGWQRTDAPDLLASRVHASLKKRHLQLVELEATRPVPIPLPATAEAI